MNGISQALPRLFLIMALIVLLSGCSVKFVYNQLDWLVPWYLDDYVTLTPAQEQLFEARLDEYLRWHRREQLVLYADLLESAADSGEDGFDSDEIAALQVQLRNFGDELFARLAPTLLELLAQLDDAQIQELFESLERENLEFQEEYIDISDKEHQRKRIKDIRRLMSRWIGDLDEPQAVLIKEWSTRYLRMGDEFIESRRQWQGRFKKILTLRDDPQALQPELESLFRQRRADRPDSYKRKSAYNEILLKALYADIDRSLTPEQREQMLQALRNMAQDFRELSIET